MDNKELLQVLNRLKVLTALACLGCEYEHHCLSHGCAIIRQAITALVCAEAAADVVPAETPTRTDSWLEKRFMDVK